ncbi:hypothetical protein QTJ16_004079 [Diplocarpon rosae]|uniref:NodB homology domain-containing protein n=1 Tax=Diplocarpon rosae TaxID=946125 RepID=A0AAD9T1L3_9HELO|nr:hypothetical protein QTJ16_004079 [Diplocarpon rosae]
MVLEEGLTAINAHQNCLVAQQMGFVARPTHTACQLQAVSLHTGTVQLQLQELSLQMRPVALRALGRTDTRARLPARAALGMDGVVTAQIIALQQQAVSLPSEPALARLIARLEVQARPAPVQMDNVGRTLGHVQQTNVARSQDSVAQEKVGLGALSRLQVSANRSMDYCNAPDCQFEYGPACDANKIPSGTNTSSIPRTQIGSVLYGSDGIYDCKMVGDMALTFDDGPFIYTSHILDLLDKYNAKATFFITGNNNGAKFLSERCEKLLTVLGKGQIDNASTEYPALIKRMYDGGHQVASHTWSHADLCNITSAQRKDEMYKNEMALRNIVGVVPTYMRPPYSSCSAACGCEADMVDLGYHVTYFNLDTSDYLNDAPDLIQNSKAIFDNALAGKSPTSDDFLVIGHDIHNQTANVLVEYMLQQIQSKGYKPVTVGDCLGDPKANWYRTDTQSTLGT